MEGSFKDLTITIKDKKNCRKPFDRRNSFPFSIEGMSYLDSNIG